MGTALKLKDGGKADIEVWGYKDLRDYVGGQKTRLDRETGHNLVGGFDFLGTEAVGNITHRGERHYRGKFSRMEKQDLSGLKNEHYCRSVAAVSRGELLGILVCNWIRDNAGVQDGVPAEEKLPFWRYYAEFLDVRGNCRNNGVGTGIIRFLDDADFLDSRILQLSKYVGDGTRFAMPVIGRELKAENYALIPHDYSVATPPAKPGIYDRIGRRKDSQ